VHHDKFLTIKPARCTNFSYLFWNETLHVSDSSSVHYQEFFTVRTAMVYVSSILILLASCPKIGMTYTIAMCTVKNSWWWTEELFKTCRISFQNKIEELVHLVGFIIWKVNLPLCILLGHMKTWIIDTRRGVELSVAHPGHFSSKERAFHTLWLGIWVIPNAGIHFFEGRKISCFCQKLNHYSSVIQLIAC